MDKNKALAIVATHLAYDTLTWIRTADTYDLHDLAERQIAENEEVADALGIRDEYEIALSGMEN